MDKTIATIAVTSELIRRYDLRLKKGYGQNFIIEPKVVGKIAANSNIDKDTAVIEIGPGIGALTQQLALLAKKVLAFEIDEKLIGVLAETMGDYSNVEVLHQDFLTSDLSYHLNRLHRQCRKVVVTANLPYYITTPILYKLLTEYQTISTVTIMVQKEIVDRLIADCGSKDYSALSVILQTLYDIRTIMRVSPTVFVPRPAVESIVVQLVQKEHLPIKQVDRFIDFVDGCFKQRRKTIYNNLKEHFKDNQQAKDGLIRADVPLGVRAEDVVVGDFIKLYEVLYES